MKIENEKIVQYIEKLHSCGSVTGYPGMMIAIVRRKLSDEVSEYLEAKQKIFQKYGTQTDNGWLISEDNPEIKNAMNEIMTIATVQMNVDLPKISEKDFLEKFVCDELTAEQYSILYDLLVERNSDA